MNKEEFLQSIRKQIHFVFDRNSIEQEFNQHIEDSIFDLMGDGYSKEEAERIAIEQMGDPTEIGKLLNEEHHPLLGYLWLISKYASLLLIIPLILLMFNYGKSVIRYVSKEPIAIHNVEKIDVDIKVDLEYHTIYLDEIYENNGRYELNFHSVLKWNKNHSGASRDMFYVLSDNEKYDYAWNYLTPFGSYGMQRFKYSDTIQLVFIDGQEIEINLKELINEKK